MVQNKDHTWGHLQQGSVTPAAAAEVTISGLAPGKYQIEQWDTTTGKVTGTTPYHSSDGRVVIVTPAELMGDVAYKVLTAQEASPMVTITPTVLTTLLKNPGMGMQTFYRTAETDANKGLIPLAAAYTRYYWGSVEPSQGDFSFAQIGNDYRAAHPGAGVLHPHRGLRLYECWSWMAAKYGRLRLHDLGGARRDTDMGSQYGRRNG